MKIISTILFMVLAMTQVTSATESAGTPVFPSPDTAEDREPVIIVQRTFQGADRAITAWIKRTESSLGQVRVATIDANNLSGTWETPTLPCPFMVCSETDTSGDPYLAENPSVSGMLPKRVYLASVTERTNGENQITIWSNYNGEASWNLFRNLSYATDLTWAVDKPSISVSLAPGTLGWVYVSHLRSNEIPACWNGQSKIRCPTKIVVSRLNSESGQFQETEVLDSYGIAVSSPIIITHPSNSAWVFLVWIDWQANRIYVALSEDYGDTFPIVQWTPAGTLLGISTDGISNGFGASVQARSMLMARFNAVSGTLGIVWHAREPDSTAAADVKFITWNPGTRTFGTRWTVTNSQSIYTPDAPTEGNQWNPAIDYDSNGEYLVTYYDTRGTTQSSTQFDYVVKAARLSSEGLRIPVSDTLVTPQESNLMLYDYYYRRNGEYQDIWSWNGDWYAAFIQISSAGDVAVSRITDSVPRDAQVLSQNVPTTMSALRTYMVSATLKNSGTETWSPVGPSPQCNVYRLGSTNPQDNLIWGRMRADLPTTVAPDGQVTVNFNITAPSTPGTYNFQWKMLQECVTWFGDSTPNVAVNVQPAPPRDAQILSQSVPATMAAGRVYPVSVTLRNVGTGAWSAVGASPQCNVFRLGSTNPQDNLTWGRLRADLPTTVAPGGQVTVNFNVTAPSTPGTYNFQWRMLQECVTWFGDSTPNVTVNVQPAPVRDAQILSQTVPSSMAAGQSYPASIRVRNVGTQTWSPIGPQCNAYRFGSANPYNNGTWLPATRVELPAPVAPGGEVTLNFTVTAPSTPGNYNFQWQMVQECVIWFGDFTPNVGVTVSP